MADREPGPGDVIGGRYEILGELGRGGMATVHGGFDTRLDRPVAVKVFRGGFSDAVDPQRTTREMRLLAAVNHPCVVSVLDASTGDGTFGAFLVMELVQGDDLGALLHRARGALSADFARRIVADIASALAALHALGVVHRDVKPANVLVPTGADSPHAQIAAKLTDFGIAQLVDGARLTASDSILGTAAYLSPEQVRGSAPRPASDVYSLGLVLLETLTGRRAFPGPAAESAMARLQRPPALPRDASPALADLLSRMTALDPAHRPTAQAVAEALRGQLAGRVTAPEAARTAPTPMAGIAAVTPAGSVAPRQEPLFTPSRGMTLSGPIVTAGQQDPRRGFPTVLAVAASALAAIVAGVAISAAAGLTTPLAPADARTAAPKASSPAASGPAGMSAPVHAPVAPWSLPASPSVSASTPTPTGSTATTAPLPTGSTAPTAPATPAPTETVPPETIPVQPDPTTSVPSDPATSAVSEEPPAEDVLPEG